MPVKRVMTFRSRRCCPHFLICRMRSALPPTSRNVATTSPMRSMFWHATRRLPLAICATLPIPSSKTSQARWPWPSWAQRSRFMVISRVRNACSIRRSSLQPASPASTIIALIMVRLCAMERPCWRLQPKPSLRRKCFPPSLRWSSFSVKRHVI
ncbi:hypothetical protein D3C81_1615660 [compost metagenome]